MQVILDIPDTLAERFATVGKSPAQAALEALAVEGYRAGHLFEQDIREMLGYSIPMQVHALLKEYDVPLQYTVDDLAKDIVTLSDLSLTHHHSAG